VSATALASYLAIDLGASSGRAVVGTFDGAVMRTREAHRFRTPIVEEGDHLYWDIDALWTEIRTGLHRAYDVAPMLKSVSVDSWAVDYVPLDADGEALRRPYSYRDARTKGRLAWAVQRAGGADRLYARTGTQFLELNTLLQLACDVADEPALVARTACRLLIAEYFLERLGGAPIAERTNASTTQLLDARTLQWATDVIVAIGDDPARWPEIVAPGTIVGRVRAELSPAGVVDPPLVLATCAHDTAAAVAAVPASGQRRWAYISSGTWSLVGAELDSPILSPAARDAGFTNEAGLDGTTRFLKNRTGMWILEECMREWAGAGEQVSYDALMVAAAEAPPSGRTVDVNAAPFSERGDMVAKIEAACRANGCPGPIGRGALVRLVLESLADSYARALLELDTLTGRRADDVHIVGGGALNDLLNQLTADACARRVLAGPDEATALGNLIVQARTLGDLPAGVTVRDVARCSARITEYLPRKVAPARPAARSVL
jgi:rhamnulokinase